MYFSQVRVDPSDSQNLYILGVSMYRSRDGGKTSPPTPAAAVHSDLQVLWIDPPRTAGTCWPAATAASTRATTAAPNWDHLNTMAIGQFYHVAIDTPAKLPGPTGGHPG